MRGRRRTASWSGWPSSSLLSDAAEEHPLVCLVDDAQWLDQASAQVLGFVARRLVAESVGLVFAARVPSDELAGLPELVVEGLGEADARALLDAALTGPLDAQVRDRIVAETRGNPLALLELPRGLTPAELAGGFALPDAMPLSGRIEESFRRRLEALPADTRVLLLVAAADPVGDPVLVWRAAERLGIGTAGGDARRPRPACWRSAPGCGSGIPWCARRPTGRRRSRSARTVHRALAEATDPELDPDRRAWHRAQAAPGPDEEVAAELERSAGRAQARGGLAAAAAFLERAAMLTPDPARRAQRLLAAARAKRDAGALDAALGLLVAAEAGPLDALAAAEVEHLRGQIALAQRRGSEAGAAAAERGQAPGAARRRPGARDAPGGARDRGVGRRPGQPGGACGRRPRPPAPRPPVPTRHVPLTSCWMGSRCG